ncbi:hypothetical protein CRG98_034302 [Punica granatum]|uniref:DUF7745 domain-containing protein n=1 Tax=Punica granatum TaxID=22663 RepID=A0A2I0IMR2_PUNGR|nr:hypothetical protein CRG98_034302 [Punica granatum]
MRIWRTLRPVDHAFIRGIIGDMVMFTETSVDWIFLRTATEFWDPEHAVFNFQGTELAPTIEEYMALIQRPTPTTHGIFVPNPFTTVQSQLSTLLHIPTQDIREELHQSHLGSTLIFPGRVIRQLGGLQDIPAEADRLPFRIQWADSTSSAPARFLQIREIRRQRDASTIQRLYFPEHPTDEERAFSATSTYVARFYPQGSTPPQRSQATSTPRATSTLAPKAESSIQAAMPAELRAVREERDRLRCKLVDSRTEVSDYRELQAESTRAHARVAHLDREMVIITGVAPVSDSSTSQNGGRRRPPPPTTKLASRHSRARSTKWPPAWQSCSPYSRDLTEPLRAPRLHQDQGRRPIRPRGLHQLKPRRTWRRPCHQHCTRPWLTPSPANFRLCRPPGRPLPPATFLSSEHVLSAPPPVSIPAPAMAYTISPPMVFPASSAPAPTHLQAAELPLYPSLQPHGGLSYQAPPPINTTFHEPGMSTLAAQFASSTYFFPEADAEQERRLKRMEETNGPYRRVMLIPTHAMATAAYSRDSLLGSALNWFMSLKAEDIPTWEDLSKRFTDQYRYCAETPPTLLELSTKEVVWGQRRMEDPTSKGEESSKKAPAAPSSSGGRRAKEVSINAVNTAHQAPQ